MKTVLDHEDLEAINTILTSWKPPRGVDWGVVIHRSPAHVVVCLRCRGDQIVYIIRTWEGVATLNDLTTVARTFRKTALATREKANADANTVDAVITETHLVRGPVIDTTGMGRG